jgi:hypothetical protein
LSHDLRFAYTACVNALANDGNGLIKLFCGHRSTVQKKGGKNNLSSTLKVKG